MLANHLELPSAVAEEEEEDGADMLLVDSIYAEYHVEKQRFQSSEERTVSLPLPDLGCCFINIEVVP
jgi:hypothetical protein